MKQTINRDDLRRLLEASLYADLSDIVFGFLGFPLILTFNITQDNKISIPMISSNSTDLFIDWSDNSSEIVQSNNNHPVEHHFSRSGNYIVHIYGYINNLSLRNCDELVEVSQWGDLLLHSGKEVFKNCSNLRLIPADSPNLSFANDLSSMFSGCTLFDSVISEWNVSTITNMSQMFLDCRFFNSELSKWDVKNVNNMSRMFYGCNSFTSNLSKWTVKNVTDMKYMFYNCIVFRSDLSRWNVQNVTNMSGMFCECSSFNSNLSEWNVGNVSNMYILFYKCTKFNSDLTKWNVENVNRMYGMFYDINNNSNFKKWNVKNISLMGDMFKSIRL